MTTICLVRHGETDWNAMGKLQGREDIPLNKRGGEQADIVGRYLQDRHFSAIYTSPLLRAKQTAERIARFCGDAPLIVNDDLIEKDYGDASGMTVTERDHYFPIGSAIPGAESLEHVKQRVQRALAEIGRAYPDNEVLAVAHGGAINALLSLLSRGAIGTGKTRLFNTCISHICWGANGWQIIDYNRIDHLAALGEITSIDG
ncbi:MAG: histidine phosphatase family protein [Sporolactobacillus sp.]